MKLSRIRKTLVLIIVIASLPLFLLMTNPEHLPLIFLLTPIALVFLIFYKSSMMLIGLYKSNTNVTKQRTMSSLLAALPTLLIVLQSIQQLTYKDVIIVIFLWLMLWWYLLKIDFI
ncbi:hypothetical protein KDA00_00685 [Candidatus Saccharibacteria bacterium]|nr:hypothetical protein [Candidatus Saccharibacteria bacterium]